MALWFDSSELSKCFNCFDIRRLLKLVLSKQPKPPTWWFWFRSQSAAFLLWEFHNGGSAFLPGTRFRIVQASRNCKSVLHKYWFSIFSFSINTGLTSWTVLQLDRLLWGVLCKDIKHAFLFFRWAQNDQQNQLVMLVLTNQLFCQNCQKKHLGPTNFVIRTGFSIETRFNICRMMSTGSFPSAVA